MSLCVVVIHGLQVDGTCIIFDVVKGIRNILARVLGRILRDPAVNYDMRVIGNVDYSIPVVIEATFFLIIAAV